MRLALEIGAGDGAGTPRVRLSGIDSHAIANERWRDALRVEVVAREDAAGERLPRVSGDVFVYRNELRFEPHFPFTHGVHYRAHFEPAAVGIPDQEPLTSDFSLPAGPVAPPPEVSGIFPSAGELPENLLRFYVDFSRPMRRGSAQAAVSLVDADGAPLSDALYRAPVELWDPAMRRLTVLLDPGRLKRGVGPNRALGPPLRAGETYALVIGAGMADIDGRSLDKPAIKRFSVSNAARTPLAIADWVLLPPASALAPLVLGFPSAMDKALLETGLAVRDVDGRSVAGRSTIDDDERRWQFVPASPWAAGAYRLDVAAAVEDVCGNGLVASFDRPLRPGKELAIEMVRRSIPFSINAALSPDEGTQSW